MLCIYLRIYCLLRHNQEVGGTRGRPSCVSLGTSTDSLQNSRRTTTISCEMTKDFVTVTDSPRSTSDSRRRSKNAATDLIPTPTEGNGFGSGFRRKSSSVGPSFPLNPSRIGAADVNGQVLKDVQKHCHSDSVISQHTPRLRLMSVNTRFNSSYNSRQKAVLTSLIVLGTFIADWFPSAARFIVICNGCVLRPQDIDPTWLMRIGIACNTLILVKCALNTLIHAIQVTEIRRSFWVLRKSRFGFKRLEGMDRATTIRRMII